MPIPDDVMLVRGDVILVRAVVSHGTHRGYGGDDRILAKIEGDAINLYVPRDRADLVETRIEVGDEVIAPGFCATRRGIVRAILDGEAWVRWADVGGSIGLIEKLADLTRVRPREYVEADRTSALAAE